LFRVALEMAPDGPEVWIWAFSWQMSQADLKATMQPMYEAVAARPGVTPRGANE
jgi:hypothetical protein